MDKPEVSVIMAVRDGQQWLRQAIDSVLAQTFSDFELVAIDDGSKDETPQILARYRTADRRVIVLTQGREGLVAALNRGLEQARGGLIARQDADDIAMPGRLRSQVQYLRMHPGTVLLGSWAQVIDDQGRPKRKQLQPPTDPALLSRTLARTNPFIHSSAIFRADIVRVLGGYRPAFEAAEDYDLWLRLSEKGDIAIAPEVLIQYRQHDGNISKSKELRRIFSIRLAKLSSKARRSNGDDPASTLTAPPDWRLDTDGAFFDESARLCRFLELADPARACAAEPSSIDAKRAFACLPDLMSAERKLAQRALVNLMRNRIPIPGYPTGKTVALLFRLNPARAMRLLWQI